MMDNDSLTKGFVNMEIDDMILNLAEHIDLLALWQEIQSPAEVTIEFRNRQAREGQIDYPEELRIKSGRREFTCTKARDLVSVWRRPPPDTLSETSL